MSGPQQDPGIDTTDPELGEDFVPAHEQVIRKTDIDPKAARRAARQVAVMFSLSALMTVAAILSYVLIPVTAAIDIPFAGPMGALNAALGLSFGLAILFIGLGVVHWTRKLMSATEVIAQRHPAGSRREARAAAIAAFDRGTADSGFTKYPILRRSLIGALLLMPLPLVVLLRDLWTAPEGAPSPSSLLRETIWSDGVRILTDVAGRPIRPEDVPVGGLVAAIPANLGEVEEEEGNLNARAKAAIILVRMAPEDIVAQQAPEGQTWDYQGILAFSKICTHVGCPIALYEQRTRHLLCPCHQSTFDLSDQGNAIFGPAARRMPQLPIKLDAEGYLVAASDFQEPVGPSFWERG